MTDKIKKTKTKRIALTDPKIRALPPPEEDRYDVYDTKSPGLFIRVGKRSKVFYLLRGSDRIKIGNFRDFHHINGPVFEARRAASDILLDLRPSSSHVPSMALGDYLDKHYAAERKGHRRPLRPQTIKSLKSFFSDWLSIPIHRINSDLLSKKITEWESPTTIENGKLKRGNTKATIRKKFILINAVFNHLVRQEHILKNPFNSRGFKIDTVEHKINIYNDNIRYSELMNYLVSEERIELEFDGNRGKTHTRAARIYIAVIIRLGLRDNEARLNNADNFVIESSLEGEQRLRLIIPADITKTGKGREVLLSCPILIPAIRDYKDNHYVHNDDGLMFFNQSTKSAYTNNLGRSLYQELKKEFKLGMNGNGSGRKYDFRHTLATRAYRAKGDIKLVADLIGDSVETASKYYVASDPEAARLVISNLE
ncbi:hypothetical protein CBP31_03000 [Oceanisphaera profunda]|uniref:Tyr recombinase domain-containing protein n=1 Tax=Oceanisphaera profunda TaxID=1416627 RepID=A0A1Y0D2I0_9GAMM|nr:phage integrase SAM-like domain-containing protein [Oceanisphaera profunda]ART81719.1 hypothetical protein CBP31_03000 [Oceanisphaera profunda]